MPELPDVAGFRAVAAEATGHRVRTVRVNDAGVLRGVSVETFVRALTGRYIGEPERHGKWLVVPTRGTAQGAAGFPRILAHFGMTGSLHWCALDESEHPHDRVVFAFTNSELRYRDMRKLTGLHLAREQDEVAELLSGLGPDAWGIGHDQLAEALAGSRRQIKPTLMDQSVLAGLGNLCVDEILWRARIHPRRVSRALPNQDVRQLHRALDCVLRLAVRAGRVPEDAAWLTGQRDVADAACPRCATPLERGRLGGRSTLWCPFCQPE